MNSRMGRGGQFRECWDEYQRANLKKESVESRGAVIKRKI